MIRRLSHSVKISGSGSDPGITFSFGKCLQLPWSDHLVLVLHQKHIRRQHPDNKHISAGHNLKITDHLLCNLQKTQSNFNFFYHPFCFCLPLICYLTHSSLHKSAMYLFLVRVSYYLFYGIPPSSTFTIVHTHKYPQIPYTHLKLSSSHQDDPNYPVSCPIVSYSIVQYNFSQLQKCPALNHNRTISTVQQRRMTALLFFCITGQLQECLALIDVSYKYT